MFWSVFSICSLYSVGTLCLACWRGGIEGSMHIQWVAGMFPTWSNDWGNAFLMATISQTLTVVKWSCEGGMLGDKWSCNDEFWGEWSWNWGTPCGRWSCGDGYCIKWSCNGGTPCSRWSCEACVLMAGTSVCYQLLMGLTGVSVWIGVLNETCLLECVMVSKAVNGV